MPSGPFSGAHVRKFDNLESAWRFVCANTRPSLEPYVADEVTAFQSLPPPPGYFIPPPMTFDSRGNLIPTAERPHFDPPPLSPAPLSLTCGDNADPKHNPVRVILKPVNNYL